jgi:hypothetical protein
MNNREFLEARANAIKRGELIEIDREVLDPISKSSCVAVSRAIWNTYIPYQDERSKQPEPQHSNARLADFLTKLRAYFDNGVIWESATSSAIFMYRPVGSQEKIPMRIKFGIDGRLIAMLVVLQEAESLNKDGSIVRNKS